MLNSPKCCGKEMKKKVETSEFEEFHCDKCGDIIYVKKCEIRGPELIDD